MTDQNTLAPVATETSIIEQQSLTTPEAITNKMNQEPDSTAQSLEGYRLTLPPPGLAKLQAEMQHATSLGQLGQAKKKKKPKNKAHKQPNKNPNFLDLVQQVRQMTRGFMKLPAFLQVVGSFTAAPVIAQALSNTLNQAPSVMSNIMRRGLGDPAHMDVSLNIYMEDVVEVCLLPYAGRQQHGSIVTSLLLELDREGLISRIRRVCYVNDPNPRVVAEEVAEEQSASTLPEEALTGRKIEVAITSTAQQGEVVNHRHAGALRALQRGGMVWFAPIPDEEDEAAVYAGRVYCEEDRAAGFDPTVNPERHRWGINVSLRMLEVAKEMGFHPINVPKVMWDKVNHVPKGMNTPPVVQEATAEEDEPVVTTVKPSFQVL